MFRGEIGNLNLPVVNVKNRISPRNTAKFHRVNFSLAGEISRWFRREKSHVISANCAEMGF